MGVRVAVFGNSFAARVQLPAMHWAGGAEVVGIAGRDRARAVSTAREHSIPHATGDWRELLELEPDLFLVSTPVDLHREMTLAALASGAAVLCEKPLALDASEAAEMHAAAAGSLALVDHELRWSPHLREMRRLLHAGAIGEPWHAVLELNLPAPGLRERPWSWWFDARRGGGMLGALGSHAVDTLRFLLGEVAAVRGELRTFQRERADAQGVVHPVTADEHARLSLRMTGGASAEIATSFALPTDEPIVVQTSGSEGVLRLANGDRLLAGDGKGPLREVEGIEAPPTCAELGLPEYGIFGRCLPLFLRELLEAVAAGRRGVPGAADFGDGLAVQRVLDAARASDAGGWVAVGAA